MMTPSVSDTDYTKDLRFAVVMYGGVSLAIYINGVAQELYRLVRSTAECASDGAGNRGALPGRTIDGTERVYRKLSHLVSHPELLNQYREYVRTIDAGHQEAENERDPLRRKAVIEKTLAAAGPDPLERITSDDAAPVRTRFTVDILSGTSAGGINAIYLAKALANDQQIDQLKELWINEGDIALLLNDKQSVMGLHLRNQDPPQSLLNSRRMYFKLLKSLNDMGDDPASASPYVDELDLFITTTDIAGVPVPLRLLDDVVYERRHKNVFHFKYGNADVLGEEQNDFRRTLNPFLAFAARCTSSFPFAFEPMRLCDIDEVLNLFGEYRKESVSKSDSKIWQRFFKEELDPESGDPVRPPRFAQRSFGDGGYLDNKPFGYAIETLMRRHSEVPVDRKLIYIEPSPEHIDAEPTTFGKPNALQNVKAAVLDLPMYETIREDLQRLLDRNRLIERVNSIISLIERDVNSSTPAAMNDYLRGGEVTSHPQAAGTGSGGPPETAHPGEHEAEDSHAPTSSRSWYYTADLVDMVERYGRYYLPYRRLRVSSVTDDIAKLIARLANFDEDSDQFRAIRSLVRVWREQNYVDNRPREATNLEVTQEAPAEKPKLSVNAFLSDYDLAYRLRRLSATRYKVDQLSLQDSVLLGEIREHAESWGKIQQALRDAAGRPRWKTARQKFPQIRLQQYAAALLPFAEEHSDEFALALRFIKCEINETFKRLRARARLLRSRTKAKPEKTEAIERAATEQEGKVNPLLPLVEKIGVTPADLNNILRGPSEGSAPDVTDQQRESDFDHRAGDVLTRKDVRENFAAVAERLRAEMARVFSEAREHCNVLFDPERVYTRRAADVSYQPISERGKQILAKHPDLISSRAAIAIRGFLGFYYHNFDDYDQIRFPIFYEADVGEADVIEVIRISPEDATSLIDERYELKRAADPRNARQKLAGVALHHFGAFLDRTWRQNDIMWGRLDGAERLIEGVLPGQANEKVREALIKEAHLAILKEELKPQSLAALGGAVSEALLRAGGGLPINEALDETLKPMKENPFDTKIDEMVRLNVADDQLVDFVSKNYQVNRQLDPKSMLNSISRATQVIGKMFEDMANANGLEGKRLAWIARLGQVFWGLIEVAVPNSILNLLLFHWLKILYFFEALIIAGAILLNTKEVQNFGWKALALTVAVHITVVLLRDYMRLKRKWQHIFLALFALVLLIVLAVGAYDLYQLGPRGIITAVANFASTLWQRLRP